MKQPASRYSIIIPSAICLTLLALLMSQTAPTAARADDWRWRLWSPVTCQPPINCAKDYCCDNYCRKPEPCVKNPLCYVCDNYQCKPAPCICYPLPRVCDDYHCKPAPLLCCPPNEPYYRCGPGNWCVHGIKPTPVSDVPAPDRHVHR